MANAERLPKVAADPVLALWGRNGVEPDVRAAGVRGFDAEQVLSA